MFARFVGGPFHNQICCTHGLPVVDMVVWPATPGDIADLEVFETVDIKVVTYELVEMRCRGTSWIEYQLQGADRAELAQSGGDGTSRGT